MERFLVGVAVLVLTGVLGWVTYRPKVAPVVAVAPTATKAPVLPARFGPPTLKDFKRSKMPTVNVAGAGDGLYDGDYPENGTLNGAPFYEKSAGYDIGYDGSGIWNMSVSTFYYYAPGTAAGCPTTGWVALMGPGPAPTVSFAAPPGGSSDHHSMMRKRFEQQRR